MHKPNCSISVSAEESIAEILIYGIIGEGDNNAKTFLKRFQELEKTASRINIRIHSPGGSVFEGLAIFNALKASKCVIHTYNDGAAASMAAMILLAGNIIHMAKGSLLMLHNVSSGEYGNAEQMRKAADTMEKYDTIITDLIAQRSGKSVEFIKANWMNFEDNYFTPDEAMEAGLIDFIETHPAENIPQNIQTLTLNQMAAFYQKQYGIDKPLFEKFITGFKTKFSNKKIKNMDELEEVPETTTEQPDTLEQRVFVLEEALTAKEADIAELKQRVDTLEGTLVEQEADIEELSAKLKAPAQSRTKVFTALDQNTRRPMPSFETSADKAASEFLNNR